MGETMTGKIISTLTEKNNHILFRDGRFYVTEQKYEAGKPSEFPREIDVTDQVKDAVRPRGFIDIDKFICGLACKLSARKKAGRGPEGLRISDLYQLLTELLAEHDVIYKDGSLIKIGESKKCEGTLGKMLKEKRGIEIPFGAKDNELQEASYYIPEGFHAEIEDNKVVIKKGEKTTAWSEEDDKMLNDILICGEHHCYLDAENIAWLKSLKDRVLPKQEWSEEDESRRKKIIHILSLDGRIKNEELSDINNWLKSLRPQSSWKPSDEPMAVLNEVINYAANSELQHWSSFIYTLLRSLREQLKKLREE